MPMYNLLEYRDNYSMASQSLWSYYREKMNNDANENNANNYRVDNSKTVTSKSFEYKAKIRGSTPDDNNTLGTNAAVPWKHLSNFSRSLDLPLINCKIELDLSWMKNCMIFEVLNTPEIDANPAADVPTAHVIATARTSALFQVNSTKFYDSVVTLPINDSIKFLDDLKQWFRKAISWNKYRSEIKTEPKINNLNYMIDATFNNINMLLVL